MANVLCVGDLHCPVERKGYLEFCQDLYEEWDCDTVVLIGDLVDWSAISFHLCNPEGHSPNDEYNLAFNAIQKWYKAFHKNVIVTIGNHDARPKRVAESVSIPAKFIRDYADLWQTPNWNWVQSIIIDNVYYCHGHGKGGGKTPAWNLAQQMGISVCMGHYHSRGGVSWSANPLRRWFGCDVGCGINDKAYAFAYAREQARRSILGAAIILDSTPYYEIMPIGKGEKYYDES